MTYAHRTLAVVFGSAALALGWLGCHSSSVDQGALDVLTVDDPFTGPPAAVTLDVDAIDEAGAATAMVHGGSLASPPIDLGTYPETDSLAVRVTARAADTSVVAWGQTLPFLFGGLAGEAINVFVQRVATFSRLPNPLASTRSAPLVGVLGARYVFAAGGTIVGVDGGANASTDLYDLGTWQPLAAPPTLGRAPLSLALVGVAALAIDTGGGDWVDLSAAEAGTLTPPESGIPWVDVAGGLTVTAPDGTAYVVGATRAPALGISQRTLVVSPSGSLSVASMTVTRAGAAAAWVPGRGLMVVGGEAGAGVDAGGENVELLGAGATAAATLDFPGVSSPAAAGSALAALDGNRVVFLAGATAQLFDLSCVSGCAPSAWGGQVPFALVAPQAFALDPQTVLVVGEDGGGNTHAFLMTSSTIAELPLRLARQHARAVLLPTGGVALVGGDPQLESFVSVPP